MAHDKDTPRTRIPNTAMIAIVALLVVAAIPFGLLSLVFLEWAILGRNSHFTEEAIYKIGLTGPVVWLYELLGGNS
jgi:hypothetical protein